MTKLTVVKTAAAIILSAILILMPVQASPVLGQTAQTVGFTMSPSVFPQGQTTSAMLCMSPLPAAGTLTFSQNDVIGFQFDNSIGTVASVDSPVLVHSLTLVPADFEAHPNQVDHNKLAITYINSTAKTFAYMDTVCAKVTFVAGAMVGSALVRYSSKFTGIAGVVGNLPYLSANMVVDFSTGVPGPQGVQGIQGTQGPKGDKGDAGPAGTSPDLSLALARLSALEGTVAPGRAYVANAGSDSVSVVNTYTNTVVATIPGFSGPTGLAIDTRGMRVYVANSVSRTVSVVDTATSAIVATIPVQSRPQSVAVNSAGTRVYVTIPDFNGGHVSIIDTSTNTVVASIPVGTFLQSVVVNTAGTRVYVTNVRTVSVIDTVTDTVIDTITVGSNPQSVAINPAGTRVYVANLSDHNLSVIDTATNTVVSTVIVGSFPQAVAVNPLGTRVYVANLVDQSISVIDTTTNTVIATVPAGNSPNAVAVNAAGTRIYVTNQQGGMSVIDTAANTILATVPVGTFPDAVAVR